MKVFIGNEKKVNEERHHMLHGHKDLGMHKPPHERKRLLNVELDDSDLALLIEVYGDEDTALANEQVILAAPPEIQICIIQLMNMIKEVR